MWVLRTRSIKDQLCLIVLFFLSSYSYTYCFVAIVICQSSKNNRCDLVDLNRVFRCPNFYMSYLTVLANSAN